MLSAKAAIQHSSAQCVLSLTPPVPSPSHTRPQAPFGAEVSTPDTRGQSMGLAFAAQLQKPHTPLTGEQLSTSNPDRYSGDFGGRNLWSSEESPVQTLLRNTLEPAAITYAVDIYLKDLILFFFSFKCYFLC